MESIEEIEEFYKKQIEELDNEFLDNTKKNLDKSKKNSEESYKEKLEKIMAAYNRDFSVYLEKQKKMFEKENKKKLSEKEGISLGKEGKGTKPFKVEKLNFGLTSKEKANIKWDLFKFKRKITFRRFVHRFVPNFLFIFWIKFTFFFKNIIREINDSYHGIIEDTKQELKDFKERLSKISSELYSKIKKALASVVGKIKRKFSKKKEEQKEKAEDEKLADKISSRDKTT